MGKSDLPIHSLVAIAGDVDRLYTHFGALVDSQLYQEVAQHEAACHAAQRWPLLAAMQGIPLIDTGGLR